MRNGVNFLDSPSPWSTSTGVTLAWPWYCPHWIWFLSWLRSRTNLDIISAIYLHLKIKSLFWFFISREFLFTIVDDMCGIVVVLATTCWRLNTPRDRGSLIEKRERERERERERWRITRTIFKVQRTRKRCYRKRLCRQIINLSDENVSANDKS